MTDPTPQPDRQTPAEARRAARAQAATVAALAVASGQPIAEAARSAGIGERTLYGWLRKPAFRRRVDEIRARMVSAAVGVLAKSMSAASATLVKLLDSRDPNVRLRAAAKVLELAAKLRDAEELERRLADVEERLAEGSQ